MNRGTQVFMAVGAAFVLGAGGLLYATSGRPSIDHGGAGRVPFRERRQPLRTIL